MPARERLCPTVDTQEGDAPSKRLTQLILSSETAEQAYRDFMWLFVGHPDPKRRRHEGLPDVLRVWHDRFYNYSEQVLAGYTDAGDLLEIRSVVPVDKSHSRDYFMVMSRLQSGYTQEPIVHQIRPEQGGMVLQLLDPVDADMNPPKTRPLMNAPAYDQWRVVLRPGRQPEILNGRRSRYEIHPIEELAEVVNAGLIERDGQLEVRRSLGRAAVAVAHAG